MSIVSIEELDKLKYQERTNYQARQAIKKIKSADNIKIRLECNNIVSQYLEHGNDNIILSTAYDVRSDDGKCLFVTDDYNLIIKAKAIGLPCQMFEFEPDEKEKYTGIRHISLTEDEYLSLISKPDNSVYNFNPNEYVIIDNTTNQDQYLLFWNGSHLDDVKIKPITNKYVNKLAPLDIYQKAFIHMLQNDSIKVKITDSVYGAGKSFLMIHWALQMLDREKFSKLYFVKSDSPPKGRKEFPALPGDINEKCDPLMGVICDATSENSLTDILLRNKQLEILPIQFAKGRSLKNAILYVNEAQDFTPSEMERLLSRIGENSVALLDGSTTQIDNRNCQHRNGLTAASNNYKDKLSSAQVNMMIDYRSDISKEVGEMDWSD